MDAAQCLHRASRIALTLRQAFFESNNRAAVALQQRVGARAILTLAGNAGLANQPNVPSLALGSGLVSPLALTAAYAAFPNGGDAVRPRAILRVLDQDGSVVLFEPVQRERVLSPEVAFQMTTLMQDVIARGTGTTVQQGGLRMPVAGKTGQHQRVQGRVVRRAILRAIVVGVWVGFDQPATIARDAFGGRIAAPDLGRLHAAVGPRRWLAGRLRCRRRSRPTSCAASRSSSRWTAARCTRNTSRRRTPSRASIARSTRAVCVSASSVRRRRPVGVATSAQKCGTQVLALTLGFRLQASGFKALGYGPWLGVCISGCPWRAAGRARRWSRSRPILAGRRPSVRACRQRRAPGGPTSDALMLSLARVRDELARATHPAHRTMLERAAAALDAEISGLSS